MIALSEPQQTTDLWRCPRCGCTEWKVTNTRFDGTQRKRQRSCLKCHAPLNTIELPQPFGYRVIVIREG